MTHQQLASAKRLVIKIGSALLVDSSSGAIHQSWLNSLIQDVAQCWQRGQEVILVSSGAIALGRRHIHTIASPGRSIATPVMTRGSLQLEQKQAAAAIGQIQLAHAYQAALAQYNITVAQVLLTLDDSENRRRYLNAKNTLLTLLKSRVIPVINENDTVATSEIRYGDNDRLAARVAQMVSADTLALLSDIDGLYTSDPRKNPNATLIPEVTEMTPDILAMAGEPSSQYGSGGMVTKLAAAKIAMAFGCKMVIAPGKHLNPLSRIDSSHEKTWFIPTTNPSGARKNWITHHLKTTGFLVIDDGAFAALQQGKSLLSAGIIDVIGEFKKGDAVCILKADKQEVARGLVNYNAHETRKIMQHKSAEFADILGYEGTSEVIHRDDLGLINDGKMYG